MVISTMEASSRFDLCQLGAEAFQILYLPSSLFGKISSFSGCEFLAPPCTDTDFFIDTLSLPYRFINEHILNDNNPSDTRSTESAMDDKTKILGGITGFVATATIGHILYSLAPIYLLKGIVLGVHHIAMKAFSFDLQDMMKAQLLGENFTENMDQRDIQKANDIASYTFLVSNIALTFFSANPILANCISYPLSMITEVALQYLYGNLNEYAYVTVEAERVAEN